MSTPSSSFSVSAAAVRGGGECGSFSSFQTFLRTAGLKQLCVEQSHECISPCWCRRLIVSYVSFGVYVSLFNNAETASSWLLFLVTQHTQTWCLLSHKRLLRTRQQTRNKNSKSHLRKTDMSRDTTDSSELRTMGSKVTVEVMDARRGSAGYCVLGLFTIRLHQPAYFFFVYCFVWVFWVCVRAYVHLSVR